MKPPAFKQFLWATSLLTFSPDDSRDTFEVIRMGRRRARAAGRFNVPEKENKMFTRPSPWWLPGPVCTTCGIFATPGASLPPIMGPWPLLCIVRPRMMMATPALRDHGPGNQETGRGRAPPVINMTYIGQQSGAENFLRNFCDASSSFFRDLELQLKF